MSSTAGLVPQTEVGPDVRRLLDACGIPIGQQTVAVAESYRTRMSRARWWGVVGASVAGSAGLLGPTEGATGLVLGRFLLGYLLGSVMAELLQRASSPGLVRSASLQRRRAVLLVPRWVLVLPYILFVPALLSPLLLLGDHPTGRLRLRDGNGFVTVTRSWFSPEVLFTSSVMAVLAVVGLSVLLRRLVTSPIPSGDPEVVHLTLMLRALTARSVAAAATAIGLTLMGGLSSLSSEPLMSRTCASVNECWYIYAWHEHSALAGQMGLLLALGGLLVFLAGRFRWVVGLRHAPVRLG